MKTKDIARQYGIDQHEFDVYLKSIGAGKLTFSGWIVEDNIPEQVEEFKAYFAEEKIRRERVAEEEKIRRERIEEEEKIRIERIAEEKVKKQQAMTKMLISSGFSFDGYKIVKYSGYISGDDCVMIGRSELFENGYGVEGNLCGALVAIRRQAIKELKEAAYELGCNAVIGVDFDYLTMDPETASPTGGTLYQPYVICVTANGNAVVIEKE